MSPCIPVYTSNSPITHTKMAFNIEVVKTGALTVKLSRRYMDINGVTVLENTPNHTHDEVNIDEIFFTILEKLSTTAQPIYHRLAYTVTDFTSVWDYKRASAVNAETTLPEYFVDLVPDASVHTIEGGGFAKNENTYKLSGITPNTLAHKVLGKLEKTAAPEPYKVTFVLQYQVDPTPLTPTGRVATGTWLTYSQDTSENYLIDGPAGEQVRLRIAYTTDNYDPGTGNQVGRLYRRLDNLAPNDATLPATIKFGYGGKETTYTPEAGPENAFPIGIRDLLYTEITPPFITPRTEVDFVLLLSDDSTPGGNTIDDVVSDSLTTKPYIEIQEHIVFKSTDNTPAYSTPGDQANFKLFKDKTTRLYTNLYWPRVYMGDVTISASDPQDSVSNPGEGYGFIDFDSNNTRVGVSIDGNNRVYMIVRLSAHSTSLSFDTFGLAAGPVISNPFNGDGFGNDTFYNAPPGFGPAI